MWKSSLQMQQGDLCFVTMGQATSQCRLEISSCRRVPHASHIAVFPRRQETQTFSSCSSWRLSFVEADLLMEHECKPAIKSCKWDFYVAKSESNRNQRVAAVTGTQFLMKAALPTPVSYIICEDLVSNHPWPPAFTPESGSTSRPRPSIQTCTPCPGSFWT